jgi:tRNA-splicing ligase RtcB (3'-phosphate/5'-hydroxy nucleic acid ligase)
MNPTQLRKLGFDETTIPIAIRILQEGIAAGTFRGKEAKEAFRKVAAAPTDFVADAVYGELARALVDTEPEPDRAPVDYRTWGTEIDDACHHQMRDACSIPPAVRGALMPDAHVGYGLPIGGVLACENAVVPYAVGVDIACRMKLSILDTPVELLEKRPQLFEQAIDKGTRFGVGSRHERPQDHPVMSEDWTITRITREHFDKAGWQLGTSGSGNHFVEFGVLTIGAGEHGLGGDLPAGDYVALLSHSGSRGAGAAVCATYSSIAQQRLAKKHQKYGRLGWLDLDTEAGAEYWAAMNLMGDYAAANHDVIHRLVSKNLGGHVLAGVENHHNFAWKEVHDGRELIVHRKGATPAGAGVLGIIPGSMATPAFVVRGKGNADSLLSASHGAGRLMSRTKARELYTWKAVRNDLLAKGIRVMSAGADEVPYVYKDIHSVMAAQGDLVETLAMFQPRIVKMSDDGQAED